MKNNIKLDNADKTQVITHQRRSIYDASAKEIFGKSLLAGFSLGLGQMLATVIFFGLIAGLLIAALRPLATQFQLPLQQLETVLEQASSQTNLLQQLPTPTVTPTTNVGE